MAAVWEVGFTVKDANSASVKNTASSKFYLGSGLTAAQAEAEAQAIIELIDDVSDGQIVDVSIALKPDFSGWSLKSSPDALANRWEKAKFIWLTDEGHYTQFNIPARKKSAVVANSEVIDTTTGGAVGTLLKSGFLAATTVDSRGEAVVSLSSAKEVPG